MPEDKKEEFGEVSPGNVMMIAEHEGRQFGLAEMMMIRESIGRRFVLKKGKTVNFGGGGGMFFC